MSKYILDIGKNWEHNPSCPLCSAIDNEYNAIQAAIEGGKAQHCYIESAIKNLENIVVNGYELVDVYGANARLNNNVYAALAAMPLYDDNTINYVISKFGIKKADYDNKIYTIPTLLYSRFCPECGSRKPDIFDTELLKDFKKTEFCVQGHFSDRNNIYIDIAWTPIDYSEYGYIVEIWKKADNSDYKQIEHITDKNGNDKIIKHSDIDEEGYKLFYMAGKNSSVLSCKDTDLEDGRVYYYCVKYKNEKDDLIIKKYQNILVPCNQDHTPKDIMNLHFIKHRKLKMRQDGSYDTFDTFRAVYDIDPKDKNFEKVIFKMNKEQVPSIDYWYTDIVWSDNDYHFDEGDATTYFLKAYVQSKVFKTEGNDDHCNYPDKYYWNTNIQPVLFSYKPFRNDIYDIQFAPSKRAMKITYKLKKENKVKYVRVVWKQDDKYITEMDKTKYKVVDVPVVHNTNAYEITISNLAANSYWVFATFPVYEDTDEDIRIEYQYIAKITPYWDEDIYYRNIWDFYYAGKWKKDTDFDEYKIPSSEHISYPLSKSKQSLMCEEIPMKDVSVLLIHAEDCAECFSLDFDYKMIAKDNRDLARFYMNNVLNFKMSNTYDDWQHYSRNYCNYDYIIARWDLTKNSILPWTSAFIKNVHIHNKTIVDNKVDNFEVKYEIKYINYHFYNHVIKHNELYKHSMDRYFEVDIKMHPFSKEDFDTNENGVIDNNECDIIGKMS